MRAYRACAPSLLLFLLLRLLREADGKPMFWLAHDLMWAPCIAFGCNSCWQCYENHVSSGNVGYCTCVFKTMMPLDATRRCWPCDVPRPMLWAGGKLIRMSICVDHIFIPVNEALNTCNFLCNMFQDSTSSTQKLYPDFGSGVFACTK